MRPQFFSDSASIFLFTTLQCDSLLGGDNKYTPEELAKRKAEIRT